MRRPGLARVHMVAPTTPTERLRAASERLKGCVHLVSIAGVTGARQRLSPDLKGFVERVRGVTDKPLAVGFAISGPEQAAEVAAVADGVIVGSPPPCPLDGSSLPRLAQLLWSGGLVRQRSEIRCPSSCSSTGRDVSGSTNWMA